MKEKSIEDFAIEYYLGANDMPILRSCAEPAKFQIASDPTVKRSALVTRYSHFELGIYKGNGAHEAHDVIGLGEDRLYERVDKGYIKQLDVFHGDSRLIAILGFRHQGRGTGGRDEVLDKIE